MSNDTRKMLHGLAWEIDQAQRIMTGVGEILRSYGDAELQTLGARCDLIAKHLASGLERLGDLDRQAIFIIPEEVCNRVGPHRKAPLVAAR